MTTDLKFSFLGLLCLFIGLFFLTVVEIAIVSVLFNITATILFIVAIVVLLRKFWKELRG